MDWKQEATAIVKRWTFIIKQEHMDKIYKTNWIYLGKYIV